MKSLVAVVLISLACLPAVAADPTTWQSVPLRNAEGSSGPARGTITVEPTMPAVSAASSPGSPSPPAQATALPDIPAAGDPAPALSVPDKATAAQLPSGLQPGQPVKTYPTLQAAAQDGINPLRTSLAPPKPAGAVPAFDIRDPQSYILALRKYLGPNGPTIAMGGALALLLGVAFMLRSRR